MALENGDLLGNMQLWVGNKIVILEKLRGLDQQTSNDSQGLG